MATTYPVNADATDGSREALPVTPVAAASSTALLPIGYPAAIPLDQMYYWRTVWQTGVHETMEAFRAGDYVEFDSDDPNDVVRWLFSAEE